MLGKEPVCCLPVQQNTLVLNLLLSMKSVRIYRMAVLVTAYLCMVCLPAGLSAEKARAITDGEFLDLYCQTVARSQQKLTRMHKSGLEAYGTETVKGDISGTCVYKTSIHDVIRVKATVTYTNYRDYDLVLNGTQIIIVNWLSAGYFIGTVHVSGKYEGHVRYDLDIKNGTASGRYYHVQHSTGNETAISYLAVQKYFSK